VHLLSPSEVSDLHGFELKVELEVKRILTTLALDHIYWSVHLVDMYIDQARGQYCYAFQMAYCSRLQGMGRMDLEKIRLIINEELPTRLGYRYTRLCMYPS
jgi:hypothetical protein